MNQEVEELKNIIKSQTIFYRNWDVRFCGQGSGKECEFVVYIHEFRFLYSTVGLGEQRSFVDIERTVVLSTIKIEAA